MFREFHSAKRGGAQKAAVCTCGPTALTCVLKAAAFEQRKLLNWSKLVCVGQESSEFGGGGSWPFWLQDTPSIIGSFGSVSSGHVLEHPAFGY